MKFTRSTPPSWSWSHETIIQGQCSWLRNLVAGFFLLAIALLYCTHYWSETREVKSTFSLGKVLKVANFTITITLSHYYTSSLSSGGRGFIDIRYSTIQFNKSLVACTLASPSLYRFSTGSTNCKHDGNEKGQVKKSKGHIERVSQVIATFLRSSILET